MTDVAPTADGAQAAVPTIRILAQYTRDLSFENPRAPDSLRPAAQPPQIDIGVEMNARGRQDGLFEVELKLSASAQQEGQAQFQVELLYGGLFEIQGVPDEHMEPVLLVECPRFLFPFARRIVSDLTSEGGFPPLMLEPIDFAGIYAAQLAQRDEADGQTAPSGETLN